MDLIVFDDGGGGGGGGGDIEAGLGCLTAMNAEKLYVAVGKEVRENESVLLWAIQNSGGHMISILHIHQPDLFIPILGKKHHWSSLGEQQVRAYRKIERQLMLRTLDEYLEICRQFEVEAEKLYIEMDSIENGMLQLIAQYNIEKLVMGAAADVNYHAKLMEPKSKKAVYLQLHAPASCHIWFICKGHLIHQRNGSSQVHAENEPSTSLRTLSLMGQNNKLEVCYQELPSRNGASRFEAIGGRITEFPSVENTEVATVPQTQLDLEANCCDWGEVLIWSEPQGSDVSAGSSSHISGESTTEPIGSWTGPYSEQMHHNSYSPPPVALAKSSENLYVEEVRKRKELEIELAEVKNDRERLREELQVAMNQISVIESKVINYDEVVKLLEEGMISNVELLEICEKERDDLKVERDNVLKTAEELLNQSAEAASETSAPGYFITLSFAEIKEATNDFDPLLQLWEDENGSIYKGVISHSQVTIRMWRPEGLQGPQEFLREVEILSKFRHPNVVTLIGVCPEACALVYEYLPSGSLEERLSCKDNTPPLSWQTRIRIATELCTALIFLHSRIPQRVVHGALKPSSLLLDSNFTCKITDFGFSRIIQYHENSPSMDPDFFFTGEVNPSVDVCSFGMILLELLTGKSEFGVEDELENALEGNYFGTLLDASAGNWPFVQAEQLAKVALRCCEENASNRPDLETEIWRVLEPIRVSCGGSPSYNLGNDEHRQAPSYFICPIFQEVMKDPHVAADGYTYEAEALRAWLDTGHDTSPMTNLQLEHCNLVPNHGLRSAIQEWQQLH